MKMKSRQAEGKNRQPVKKKLTKSRLMKLLSGTTFAVAACTFGGCMLAVPDAGTDGNSDRLIGAFITSEYLDLYDMEGYLNDHASSLAGNSSITVGKDSRYEGKLVAAVDKEGADSSSEWKVSFGNINGEYILMPVTEDENGNTSVGNLCSDGACESYLNYAVTDDGEEQDISVTIYQQSVKGQQTYYVNPVYQAEDGTIYAMTGNGYADSMSSEEGNTIAATLTGESTMVENGKTKKDTCKVSVQFTNMYKPVRTIIYQMDAANKILKQVAYNPSQVPDTLKVESGTAYILEEIRKENPSGEMITDRKILNLKGSAEEADYLEIWYPLNNGLIGKKEVEILY